MRIRTALLIVAFTVVAGALSVRTVSADVYMVKDSRGIVYFTNIMPNNTRGKIIKTISRKQASLIPATIKPDLGMSMRGGRYDTIIRGAARKYNLDPYLVKAVAQIESGFKRFSVSSKGAKGLMQLMPITARELKVKNVFDPMENIYGGAKYLRKMLDRFDENLKLAIAAYNAGPSAVTKYKSVPPYPETIRYVEKVVREYDRLKKTRFNVDMASAGETERARPARSKIYRYKDKSGRLVFTDVPMTGAKVIIN